MPTLAEVEALAREVSANGIKNARRGDRTMSDHSKNATSNSMGQLVTLLTTYRRAIHRLRSTGVGVQESYAAADTIAFAWEFAGSDDATSTAKGGEVLQAAQEIDAKLAEIDRMLGKIRGMAARASEAVVESEAKRKTQKARLTL
jgi:hypothetical protein